MSDVAPILSQIESGDPSAAELLRVSQSTAEADWTFTKAWLKREMEKS